MSQPSQEALQKAKAIVEANYLDPNSSTKIHSVGIGYVTKDGQLTDEVGVVVTVADKVASTELPPAELIPPTLRVATDDPRTPPQECVRVDVQQAPQFTPKLLRLDVPRAQSAEFFPESIGEWRACFDSPIPGGVQIAPRGAPWVGTLGGAVRMKDGRYGALTNNHVAVFRAEKGYPQCQPSGNSAPFAKLEDWTRFNFARNAANRCDVAILDTLMTEPPFNGRHTVKPEQFKIGRINPDFVAADAIKLGDRVQKSGRTTGHQFGKVVQVDVTTFVGYDGGDARFVRQISIRGESGLFSNSGDSGSLILTPEVRPHSLLFAGGGDITIASPIQFVMEDFGITFF